MRTPGRIAAAIEIITEICDRGRPAAESLKDWGKAHRFAGSGDRHVIGTLVFDCLRNRSTAETLLGAPTARGRVLGTLALVWKLPVSEIEAFCAENFGPGALSESEKAALSKGLAADLPAPLLGNFPAWLEPQLQDAFGDDLVPQMQALMNRAPIDLRVNSLKAEREEVLEALAKYSPVATPHSPLGIRISAPGVDARNINVEAETSHGLGQFEVQDEASQIAAAMTGVMSGMNVLDICAGAGGKTLALSALMHNEGKLVAYDRDKHRLRPIFERMNRAGASCIEVVGADENARLSQFDGFDVVVVDAPCTGSGTWRRKPDAKWRLTEKQLNIRLKEQRDVLDNAAQYVRRGGKICYFTCSILPAENAEQVQIFLEQHREFHQQNINFGGKSMKNLQLTPLTHGTDGFFMSVLVRS